MSLPNNTRLPSCILLGFLLLTFAPDAPAQLSSSSSAPITFPVTSLSIKPVRLGVTLQWSPVPYYGGNVTYEVWSGHSPYKLTLIGTTRSTSYFHKTGESSFGFYKVAVRSRQFDYLDKPERDDAVILDFEEGDFALGSFSEEEDIEPDAWEIDTLDAFGESTRSLKLKGNCWKTLEVDSISIIDATVWSFEIKSIDGDTLARLQAVGIGDGQNQLFYAFYGMNLIWDVPWVVSLQDSRDRGNWEEFQLAVGYDWVIRYGYEPQITEFYFINDNDNNDSASTLNIDELIDITDSVPPKPSISIAWRFMLEDLHQQTIDLGGTVAFDPRLQNYDPEEVDFLWDFGDGTTSILPSPTHFYSERRDYTVSLEVSSPVGGRTFSLARVAFEEGKKPRSMYALFAGDVMLARRYMDQGQIIRERGPEAVFEQIRPITEPADLCVVNLECVLSDRGTPHPTKGIVFRAPPQNAVALTYAGIDMVGTANNHIHDYGQVALEQSMSILDSLGIAHAGAGMNEAEALEPVIKLVNGLYIGFLAFCNRTGRDANERPTGDAAYDKYGFAYFSADNIVRSVPQANAKCDVLVLYVHGGYEYAEEPERDDGIYPAWSDERMRFDQPPRDSATIELSHLAIDLGADLVIAHHPHVLQGFSVYDNVVLAHSMGNFAFDQNFFETWPSAIVRSDITEEGIQKVTVLPLFVNRYVPTPATGDLGRKILNRLANYTTDLGSWFIPNYDSMSATIVIDPEQIVAETTEDTLFASMRYYEADSSYVSEPIRLTGAGFPSALISIDGDVEEPAWRVSLGRDILLVGNMELEGADIWNYNSNWENPDQDTVRNGLRSSHIHRAQGARDGITDLIQKIPTNVRDRLTLCGWLKTQNARDGGLFARYYRYRYDERPENIFGDQLVEQRLNGDNDWTYVWDELVIPNNTGFVNVRWQLFGAEAGGENHLWADDVDLIRWDEPVDFNGAFDIPAPNETFYLQVRTYREVDQVQVIYRMTTLECH